MKTISNSVICLTMVGVLWSTPTIRADAMPEAVLPDGDVLEYYARSVRPLESGEYEQGGWLFLHQRVPMAGSGMSAEMRALRKAMAAANRCLMNRLESAMSGVPTTVDQTHEQMRSLVRQFNAKTVLNTKKFESIPSRILSQTTDGESYVFCLAMKESDLKAEIAKGRYENRTEVIRSEWKNVVRSQSVSTNRLVLARSVGALDWWTLQSGVIAGERVLTITNGADRASVCATCLKNLIQSSARAGGEAAVEYRKLLAEFPTSISNELVSVAALTNSVRTRLMISSFASCQNAAARPSVDDLDAFAEVADGEETDEQTLSKLIALTERTPGFAPYWVMLGRAFAATDRPVAAISSFRNALRLTPDAPEILDALAGAYRGKGCKALAKGAALLAVALGGRPADSSASYQLLGL